MEGVDGDRCETLMKHWETSIAFPRSSSMDSENDEQLPIQVSIQQFAAVEATSPRAMVLLNSRGKIGAWMQVTGTSSRMCQCQVLLGARDQHQEVLVLMAKRIFSLFLEMLAADAIKRGLDPMNSVPKTTLMIGVGIPELFKVSEDEAYEICKSIETYVAEDIFALRQ